MRFRVYIVNAFSEDKFGGNPAAVVPLKEWLSDTLMQQIASQNNLPETAFFVPEGDDYRIRWFTPVVEVNLCGHATLASAHVLFGQLGYPMESVKFQSRGGLLKITRKADGRITLDFPADTPKPATDDGYIEKALGIKPNGIFTSLTDYMVVLGSQAEIEALQPDLAMIKKIPVRGLIVTARGNEVDFVSRCFFPQSGIDEDPVTGSAHVVMVPYWAEQTGKNKLTAVQLSARRGYLDCELAGDRVLLTGRARTYLEGDFYI